MKNLKCYCTMLLLILGFVFSSCDPESLFGSDDESSSDSGETTTSSSTAGLWYASGCNDSKAHILSLNNGIGYLSTKDCNGICSPIKLEFSYTISGNSVVFNYYATQPFVKCTGYEPSRPKPVKSSSHFIAVSGKQLQLDNQLFYK
jgi:hypothetical protein